MGERTVNIRELDLTKLKPENDKDFKNGVKYVMIGKPGSGKSTVIKELIFSKKHIFPVMKVHSGTEDSNGFFGEWVPDLFIEQGLESKGKGEKATIPSFENFRKRQKLAKNQLESRGMNPWGIMVVDDCTSTTSFFKAPVMQDAYKNGRHWRWMYILSLQYAMDLPSDLRGLVDGVFIFKETNLNNRERLRKNFGGNIETKEWNDLMDQLTEDYHCIFIDTKVQSNEIEDYIFYFKSNLDLIPKDWKFGCKEYREFAKQRYNPNYNEL
jgi:hypothetical protein